MLFTTPTQWIALVVALIAGWLFGLASHPGGRKWKERYADERAVHGANRKQFDARLAEANARIRELEQENERLARAAPVTTTTTATTHAPLSQTVTRPAPASRARWFDWNNRVGTTG